MSSGIDVLHVDDDPSFTDLTATFLQRENHQFSVQTATSAEEGLERINDRRPDCVVSDYNMPGMNGLEFLRTVRENNPDLPFILYTGKGSETVASDAIAADVTDYLQKGSGAEQYKLLANRIQNAVQSRREAQRADRQEELMRLTEFVGNTGGFELDTETGKFLLTDGASRILNVPKKPKYDFEDGLQDFHPDDRESIRQTVQRAVKTGERTQGTWRYQPPGRENKLLDVTYMPTTANGDTHIIRGAIHDITDRKERKQVLEQLSQRMDKLIHAEDRTEIAGVAVNVANNIFDAPLAGVHLLSDDRERFQAVAANDDVREEFGVPPEYSRADDNIASELVCQTFDSGTVHYVKNTKEYGTLAEETPAKSAIIHPLGDHGVFILSTTEPKAFDETDRNLIELVAQTVTTALDRVERETDLRENKQRLKRERDRFEQFLSVVSHDLRNPLGVAEGYVELAQDTGETKHLQRATNALDRSQALIKDLLTLAQEGEDVTEPEPVKLVDVAQSSWQTVETTQGTLEADLSQVIEADRSRLKQLFENLYRNAVEHSGDEVIVSVGVMKEGFYVADTGPGIPESEHEKIFEAGYSTTEEGTGFGLSIIEQIAGAHGWDITVTESEQGGTRFEFTGVKFVD